MGLRPLSATTALRLALVVPGRSHSALRCGSAAASLSVLKAHARGSTTSDRKRFLVITDQAPDQTAGRESGLRPLSATTALQRALVVLVPGRLRR